MVEPDLIRRILTDELTASAAAQRLVRAALAAGTHDNVTAVVGDVVRGAAPRVPAAPGHSGWLSAGPPTS